MTSFVKSAKRTYRKHFWNFSGHVSGSLASWPYTYTGVETALHEIVGHGMLGMRLTSDYAPGTGPTYWVCGYEQFKAIGRASSAADNVKSFFSWLLLPSPTRDGAVGLANRGQDYHPNALAKHLGTDRTSAWISVTGSLPSLGVNALCVAAGMTLRKKHPTFGSALISFGVCNTLIQSMYAWDAVVKIYTNSPGIGGHDFLNFANRMSLVLGFQASTIALSTAFFFSGFVPLIAVCMYLSEKSHENELFERRLPRHKLSKLEKALGYASTSSVVVGAATQMTGVLSLTIAPTLTPVAMTLKTIHPILELLSIAQHVYETYKDLHAPTLQVPLLAKILSCLKLAVTMTMATSMLVAALIPGMHFIFIPAVLISTLSSVLLSYAKNRAIQSQADNASIFSTDYSFFSRCSGKKQQYECNISVIPEEVNFW